MEIVVGVLTDILIQSEKHSEEKRVIIQSHDAIGVIPIAHRGRLFHQSNLVFSLIDRIVRPILTMANVVNGVVQAIQFDCAACNPFARSVLLFEGVDTSNGACVSRDLIGLFHRRSKPQEAAQKAGFSLLALIRQVGHQGQVLVKQFQIAGRHTWNQMGNLCVTN